MNKKIILIITIVLLAAIGVSGCIASENQITENNSNSSNTINDSNESYYDKKFANGTTITTIENIEKMNKDDVEKYLNNYFTKKGYEKSSTGVRDEDGYYSFKAGIVKKGTNDEDYSAINFSADSFLVDKKTGEVRKYEI